MKTYTPRQRILYLSAKLYELAAEFSDEELEETLHAPAGSMLPKPLRTAIRGLRELHSLGSSMAERTDSSAQQRTIHVHYTADADQRRSRNGELDAIAAMLGDRSAFPSVASLAKAVGVEARRKEPRDRFLARILKEIEVMTSAERAQLIKSLPRQIDDANSSGNFITKWSNLIKAM